MHSNNHRLLSDRDFGDNVYQWFQLRGQKKPVQSITVWKSGAVLPCLVIHPQCFPKVRFLFSCLFPHMREALWDGRVSECSCCYTVPVHGMLEGNMAWFSTAQGNAEHAGLWQHIWVWVELTADTWFPCQAPFVPVKLIWVVTTCAGKVFLQSRRMRLGILSEDVWNVPRYTRVSDWKYVPIYWAFRKAGLTQTPLQVVQGRELLKGPPNGVDLPWVQVTALLWLPPCHLPDSLLLALKA